VIEFGVAIFLPSGSQAFGDSLNRLRKKGLVCGLLA